MKISMLNNLFFFILKMKFSSTYFKRASEPNIQSILKQKKKKIKHPQSESIKNQIKKSHSLNDVIRVECNKILTLELPLDLKAKNLLLKKYSSVTKEEKIVTIQNQLFTTQTQDNVLNTNENCFVTEHDNNEKKATGFKHEIIQPNPKHDKMEIIIFEDDQDKYSSLRLPNVLNRLPDENTIDKNIETKLHNELLENELIYINKNNLQNYYKEDINEIRFKSLPDIIECKLENFEQTSSKNNDESVLPSGKMDKSLINCLICFDKIPNSVFMECGHGGIDFKIGEFLLNCFK